MGDGERRIDRSAVWRGIEMKDFRRLQVWEKAHMLTLGVYRATAGFPREERFGLSAQLRRASASIPSNIAEGCGRSGNRELARFLQVGMGSARELEYQLLLARDLGYIEPGGYASLEIMLTAVEKMLGSLIRKVRIDEAAPNAGPRATATRSKQSAAT
jgi:four helix bundle protein